MIPEVQYYHSFTVMIKLHEPGYVPSTHQLQAWQEFAQSVIDETPSMVGLCYSFPHGAFLFTFAMKGDAWAFMESWRAVLKGDASWPVNLGPNGGTDDSA